MSPWQAGRQTTPYSIARATHRAGCPCWRCAGAKQAPLGISGFGLRGRRRTLCARNSISTRKRSDKKKTRNKQNKLKSSQSTNLIYALYAHKNVKNCFATAPCCLPPPNPPTTHGNCVRRFVCDCVLLSLSLSPLSCLLCWTWTWAAERMRAYFALIGKRSHHQAGSTTGEPPTMTLNVQSTRI